MRLEVDRIQACYGENQVLFDVSLDVGAGEAVALLGASGAGKTTTLRAILGLTPASSGNIRFEGAEITRWPTHRIARAGVGWVPEERRVFPSLTVERNLSIARKPSPFRAWTLAEAFGLFSVLEHLMPRECENLSGGELQMVAIARALVGGPGLLLMDEPSQGLAPRIVQDVIGAIDRLKAAGVAVLIVEQNARSALTVADRVYVMDRGHIIHHGAAAALLADTGLADRLLGGTA